MWAIDKRPKTFDEVIGQQEAINTLMKTKDEATTYILHGSSGVGKTTIARIFANEQDAEIIEINGADNNGVDSIRALVDMAMYVPAFTSKRAFIIDECHSLTSQAWNALLKILEEAPKTTLWLLCTTEYSKIPLTIKSRSISIRLRDINKSTMKSYLQSVARSHTSFEVTGEVLDAIVSRSEGRVREALTTLETYVTTGVLDYKFDTLDIIHFIEHLFKGEAMKLQSYLDDLTNEDVYAIINFVKDYMKFLMIFPQSGGMKAEEVLDKYTSISSTHLNALRDMQQEIWQACPYDGEPMPTTVRYLYEVYDVMMKHYNDFRDSRSAFEIALYAIMEGTKNG